MIVFNIILIINNIFYCDYNYSGNLIEKFTDLSNLDEINNNLGFDMLNKLKLANPTDSFCESYMGQSHKLNIECSRLTKDNCDITPCCVRTSSDDKCKAGNVNGATFVTKKEKYYHLGQCYNGKKQNAKC